MFPYSQQPTSITPELGQQPEYLSADQKALLRESLHLSDEDFARAAMHPEVLAELERQAAAKFDFKEPIVLTSGWLNEVNESTLGQADESDQPFIEHNEPSEVERLNAAHIEAITALTPRLAASRRSEYVKRLLAGKTREDFDLAA